MLRMDLGRPLRVVTPTIDGDVLVVLARAPETEFTPPQIHRVLETFSVEGVRRCLARLVEQGIVVRREAGRAALYRFNVDHVAAEPIVALARAREVLIERMRVMIGEWEVPCAFAALFGSAARSEMRNRSDIDVFVVRPDDVDPDDLGWADQLITLARAISAWTGNEAQVLTYSEADLRRGHELGDLVLRDIERDGIRLAGPAGYLRRGRPVRSARR